jgi:hypothetical protein
VANTEKTMTGQSLNLTKRLLVFICALVCTPLTAPLFCQFAQMEFPLHVGDRWQYVEAQSYFSDSRVLGDTIMPNGLKFVSLSGLLSEGYYRREGSTLYRLSGGTDRLLCDFSKKPGDTLAFYRDGFDTTMVVVYDQGLWQCFDKLRYQMRFFHVSKHSPGLIRAIYHVADSVGFIRLDQETVHIWLAGALINGRLFGVITSVAEAHSSTQLSICLSQNYPNPFNPSTTISYRLPTASRVTVRVFNALGQEVAVLVDEDKQAGVYQVRWTANVPSGVYFYRIQTAQYTVCKKMVFLH